MSKKNVREWARKFAETLIIFRRSLIFQTKEFFQNSTLHGVRYIAESGRPVGEKFMWFCFTSIGAVTALVIIMSLWEKFQTNPTITGLDTDFHNQNVVFPTTIVCPEIPFDHDKAYDFAYRTLSNYDHPTATMIAPFLELLTSLNFDNINEANALAQAIPENVLKEMNLREAAFKARVSCESTLTECKYRDEPIPCCTHFDTVYTEHGMCFAFNSRFKSETKEDVSGAAPHDLYETDKKWALFFIPNGTANVFIFSNEEYFGRDFNAQIEWEDNQKVEARISKKNTYTTDDARQLTIGQRKCIFYDEVKLQYFPEGYTFSSCMTECRMKRAIKLCKCNPPFYKPIPNAPMCGVSHFSCLEKYKVNITSIKNCMHCELSCSKTVFNIEKLIKSTEKNDDDGVLVEFLTWPIIRYKREVLFGWVDLLVSFGGIASLFLGFSLLSGVEIIYYFTLRACCMVYKNRQELYEIEEEIKCRPPPAIDLSLRIKPYVSKTYKPVGNKDDTLTHNNLNSKQFNEKNINMNKRNNFIMNATQNDKELNRRRKADKDYNGYSKSLYKSKKIIPQYTGSNSDWQYGQYLP
ncbi:PREDICTED: sodium channel protein Nach-like [Rhagoletis zephyria]|uniref:sodium channel protein Nach-like n=1 Tax=Rhagoletis zephyria TaxID=28612 RepID=UPI00081120E1|nr:PREDICTED: sodium channel protein Nach-like [Rhagoletis zephyria]